MQAEVEQVSLLDQQFPECADLEEDRVRQSECVNMNVVALHESLRRLGYGDLAGGGVATMSAARLPPEMVDALWRYLARQEEDIVQLNARAQLLDEQRARDTERAEVLHERTEKVKNAVASMSAKSSADMKEFREHMQQNANAAKQRQRELVDLTRKREKLEHELKRAHMQADRLRKIAKRVR